MFYFKDDPSIVYTIFAKVDYFIDNEIFGSWKKNVVDLDCKVKVGGEYIC